MSFGCESLLLKKTLGIQKVTDVESRAVYVRPFVRVLSIVEALSKYTFNITSRYAHEFPRTTVRYAVSPSFPVYSHLHISE